MEYIMKHLLVILVMITAILSSNVFSKPLYVIAKEDNTKLYKNSTGNAKTKAKLTFGETYTAGSIEKDRILIPTLNSWVDKKTVMTDYSKGLINEKAKYLVSYNKDKNDEKQRRIDIVKKHPEWNRKTKKNVTDGMIVPNWPESLIVASWGTPTKKLNFVNKAGVTELRLLYGQKLFILENDSLKFEKMHYTQNLNMHLNSNKDIVDSLSSDRNDSTLAE